MKKPPQKASELHSAETLKELDSLRQEARAALDLAVVALAPALLIDQLATAAGLLESLAELPADSPPVIALVPKTLLRAKGSLADWRIWHKQHLETRIPSS
jgi:hypothetical protein